MVSTLHLATQHEQTTGETKASGRKTSCPVSPAAAAICLQYCGCVPLENCTNYGRPYHMSSPPPRINRRQESTSISLPQSRTIPPIVLSTWKPYLPFGLRLLCICASCAPMNSALSGFALPPMFRCSKIAKQPDTAAVTEEQASRARIWGHESNFGAGGGWLSTKEASRTEQDSSTVGDRFQA